MIDPKTLKYASSHEWVKLDGDIATVGISKFAVDQLTDLILIDLPAVGKVVSPGKSFGEVESVKAVSDIYSPVSGEIIEVNPAVAADVQVLAQDPYDAGWLVKVKISPESSSLSGLLDFDAYQAKIADEAH